MTSRQQRRAAERTARKQSVRSGSIAPSTATHHHYSAASSAPSQPLHHDYSEVIAATTAAILYPGEDLDRYRNHLLHFFQQHTPAPGLESVVVKRLADFQWRLERIASLEAALMALGRHRFAELFADADPALRTALTDAHTLVVDGIPLKRLHLQESRLRRYYAGDLAELAALKEKREQSQLSNHSGNFDGKTDPASCDVGDLHSDVGFEFSNPLAHLGSECTDSDDCLTTLLGSEGFAELDASRSVR